MADYALPEARVKVGEGSIGECRPWRSAAPSGAMDIGAKNTPVLDTLPQVWFPRQGSAS